MQNKLKNVLFQQTELAVLAVTPSGKEYWFNLNHELPNGPAVRDLTFEKLQVLETTVTEKKLLQDGYTPVFYVSEPQM